MTKKIKISVVAVLAILLMVSSSTAVSFSSFESIEKELEIKIDTEQNMQKEGDDGQENSGCPLCAENIKIMGKSKEKNEGKIKQIEETLLSFSWDSFFKLLRLVLALSLWTSCFVNYIDCTVTGEYSWYICSLIYEDCCETAEDLVL